MIVKTIAMQKTYCDDFETKCMNIALKLLGKFLHTSILEYMYDFNNESKRNACICSTFAPFIVTMYIPNLLQFACENDFSIQQELDYPNFDYPNSTTDCSIRVF